MSTDSPTPWPGYLNPYSMELKFQLLAAKTAFDSLEAHLRRRKELAIEFNRAQRDDYIPPLAMERAAFYESHLRPIVNLTGPILGDVQGFLAAAGVIASVLWPSQRRFREESSAAVERRIARGVEIRNLLGVTDASILNSRTGRDDDVRGGFLHFDEMIDEFRRQNPTDEFVSFDIGSAAEGTSIRRTSAVRWLDEDNLDLYVNGRRGNLRDLWNEIFRVLGRVQIASTVQLFTSPRTDRDPPAMGIAFGSSGDL